MARTQTFISTTGRPHCGKDNQSTLINMQFSRYCITANFRTGRRWFSASVVKPSTLWKALQTKVSKNEQLSIGDLSDLLKNCNETFHYKYAVKGVKLYQRSGFDFNQEICSLFIKVCTESGKPELAADLLSKHEERIGSWLTRKSMTNLINQLVSNENGVGIASKVIVVSWMKGVYAATPEIVELVKSAAEKSQSIDDENVQNMLSLSAEKLSKIAA